MDTRDIYKLVRELSEERDDIINLHDSVGIELSEDFVIETGVVGFMEDGVIIHLDEDAMEMLDLNGILLEAEEQVDEGGYGRGGFTEVDDFKRKLSTSNDPFEMIYGAISGDYGDEIRDAFQEMYDAVVIDSQGGLHPDDDFETIINTIVDQYVADGEVYESDDQLDELTDIKRLSGWHEVDEAIGDVTIRSKSPAELWKQHTAPKKSKIEVPLDPKTGKTLYQKSKDIIEAEYQGRKVTLNKPFSTPDGPKKKSVYVKKPNGSVVKVNFGDKNMKIKKSNPDRRKSFRARHKCDNPGPKWKARYWSCRAW